MNRFPAALATAGLAAVLGGCIPVELPPTVPAALSERIPAPPASTVTLIWQPGHYDWDGRQYVWQVGRWIPRAGHGPLWQDGSWRRDGASWAWVPAHWI